VQTWRLFYCKDMDTKTKQATKYGSRVETQRRIAAFAAAYGRTGNATQAAIDAGYSVKTARTQGSALLTKPDIFDLCSKARAEYLAACENVKQRQRKMLEAAADDAIAALQTVVQGKVSRGAVAMVSAATAILDRAGHKPVDESKIAHTSPDGSMTPRGPVQIVIEGG
jgi:phage terminase small subunit